MQINTFVRYNFLVDLYVARLDTTNEVTVYVADELNMSVNIVSGRQQTIMFTQRAVEFGARLVNVRNPHGELLFQVDGVSYDMHVHSNDPVIDVYGNIVGYRQVLREPQPVITNMKDLEPDDEELPV